MTHQIEAAIEILKDYDLEEALRLLTDIVRRPEDFLEDPVLGKVAEAFGPPGPARSEAAAATPP